MVKTIVDTHGKVLQQGTSGVRVLSEDGVHLLDIGEVSDEAVMNVFFHLQQPLQPLVDGRLTEPVSSECEILVAKEGESKVIFGVLMFAVEGGRQA